MEDNSVLSFTQLLHVSITIPVETLLNCSLQQRLGLLVKAVKKSPESMTLVCHCTNRIYTMLSETQWLYHVIPGSPVHIVQSSSTFTATAASACKMHIEPSSSSSLSSLSWSQSLHWKQVIQTDITVHYNWKQMLHTTAASCCGWHDAMQGWNGEILG